MRKKSGLQNKKASTVKFVDIKKRNEDPWGFERDPYGFGTYRILAENQLEYTLGHTDKSVPKNGFQLFKEHTKISKLTETLNKKIKRTEVDKILNKNKI